MSVTGITAIVDTNVVIDAVTVADLERAILSYSSVCRGSVWEHPIVSERLRRVRAALMLAIHLDRLGATTISPFNEVLTTVDSLAPMKARGGRNMGADYVRFYTHFVMGKLLPGWKLRFQSRRETEKGDKVDLLLLKWARESCLPLVTNEGRDRYGRVSDAKKRGMRRRATAAGVEAFTPEQFIETLSLKLDGRQERDRILESFDRHAPRFIAERRAMYGNGDRAAGQVLTFMNDVLRLALDGPPQPLPAKCLPRTAMPVLVRRGLVRVAVTNRE